MEEGPARNCPARTVAKASRVRRPEVGYIVNRARAGGAGREADGENVEAGGGDQRVRV